MKHLFLPSAAIVFVFLSPAMAQNVTEYRGEDLVRDCQFVDSDMKSDLSGVHSSDTEMELLLTIKKLGEVKSRAGFCAGYFAGLFDMNELYVALHAKPELCLPEMSLDQMRKVFLKYAGDHPEDLHKPASLLWYPAFLKAFPCEATK